MRLAPLIVLAACADPAKDLGDVDADLALLAEVPALAHLAAAAGEPDATVLDLMEGGVAFGEAPDPTDYFGQSFTAHADLPVGEGQRLSVLTYNTGLLSRIYLVFKVAVPEIEARRARMAEEVFGADHDIIFLQEVWEMDDARSLAEAGEAAGYRVMWGDKRGFHKETGLLIAVREDLVGDDEAMDRVQFAAQWKSENFPGPNLKRGWLHWSFSLPNGGPTLHLFDTHLTPFYTKGDTRNLQVRELGLQIAGLPADDLVLVGGDFNAGWAYPRDVWTDAEGAEHPGWWANSAMAPLFAHYGGLTDLANLAQMSPEVQLAADLGVADASWLEQPYGDTGFCEAAPGTFTATDCNGLYHQNYAATEFPARMDLLWLRDTQARVRARSRELAFTEPLDFGGDGSFELSDHYGQVVEIELLAP